MSTRGSIIAAIATAHVGGSATKRTDLYDDVVVRPVDRVGRLHPFYHSDPRLSTCALFVVGVWRLAGIDEPETTASYCPPGGPERDAFVDEEVLAGRYGAFVRASSAVPTIAQGDAWIITDAAGGDGHTGIATTDLDPSTMQMGTVEGGQADVMGSTGTGAFTRTLVHDPATGRWMMGHRYLYAVIRAELLPIPLPVASVPPDPHVDPDATIEPA